MAAVRRSSFNPAQYRATPVREYGGARVVEPESHTSSHYGTNEMTTEEMIRKGGPEPITIDLHAVEKSLCHLRANASQYVSSLQGQLKTDYRCIFNYIQLLHGSADFNKILELINKKFADLDRFIPGTIGGYLGGCFLRNNLSSVLPTAQAGCALGCADTLNPSEGNGWAPCDSNVIVAHQTVDGYEFNVITEVPGSARAIVYIDNSLGHGFHGFSDTEKEYLARLGITELNVLTYQADGTTFADAANGLQPLSQVKSRVSTVQTPVGALLASTAGVAAVGAANGANTGVVNNVPTNTGTINGTNNAPGAGPVTGPTGNPAANTLLIILLIIVALVILYFAWRSWSNY